MIEIPDVSEYQTVDWSTFAGPIIVRAHNGTRADRHWPENAAGAARQPWWAVYQYLPASVDATLAARWLLATITAAGVLPWATILDLEEGTGDQRGRQHDWLTVMAADPATDWTYSGLYFARTHGPLAVEWIAAYGQAEPTDAHQLWQYTNSRPFAGISGPCDASRFAGTVADLQALTKPGETPVTPTEVAAIAAAVETQILGKIQTSMKAVIGNPSGSPAGYTAVSDQLHALAAAAGLPAADVDQLVRQAVHDELAKLRLVAG